MGPHHQMSHGEGRVQISHKNVTKNVTKCHKNVTKMSQKCHKNIITVRPHIINHIDRLYYRLF